MDKIRVLVVDDSVVVRRVLTTALSADVSIDVVGSAADGKIALAKISQLKPDLITLDIEMPVMNGLETLTEVRKLYPQLPVIMFSSATEAGAQITLDALARGANDYATKPSNTGSISASVQNIQQELIPKIKIFCQRSCPVTRSSISHSSNGNADAKPLATMSDSTNRANSASSSASVFASSESAKRAAKPAGSLPAARVNAVVIGTSTGGPNALSQVIPRLPAQLTVPVFIVQHMPPLFTARLAQRLDQQSAIHVVEAAEGMVVLPGTAYLAPGGFHMKLVRNGIDVLIKLTQDAPECSCRPSVDVLFRSAAETYGANLLAVVLTGMGQDGMRGCELVCSAGGQVLAQDESTSVVWGMPGAVCRAGLTNEILPLDSIAVSIQQRLRRKQPSLAVGLEAAARQ
jgi:two-component system, chemotaxis family, protein-glutamate methylesterase/glutaminase